jgi:hypothetical protein
MADDIKITLSYEELEALFGDVPAFLRQLMEMENYWIIDIQRNTILRNSI